MSRVGCLHMLGARPAVGFGYGDLFTAAGNIAEGIQTQVEAKQKADAASASDRKKLAAAIAADGAWAVAQAQALASAAAAALLAPSSDPRVKVDAAASAKAQAKASADQLAADAAAAAEDSAGAQVPPELAPQRIAAAQEQLGKATAALQAAPTSAFAQGLVKAWGQVINKAQNVQITKSAPEEGKGGKSGKKGRDDSESFLTQKHLGVPTYGLALGGAALGAGIWYAVKKGLFHRLFG